MNSLTIRNISLLVAAFLFLIVNAGCQRKGHPTEKPEVVRIGVDRAFVIPPPYNAPTRPDRWTGKDQVPRFPEANISKLPIDRLRYGFWVSEILERADLSDEKKRFSKDYVHLDITGIDGVPRDFISDPMRELPKTSPPKWLSGAECFSPPASKDQYCLVRYKDHELKITIDDEKLLPNPHYYVSYYSKKYGHLTVMWHTSKRNISYWMQIQDAVMQRIDQWRYDNN